MKKTKVLLVIKKRGFGVGLWNAAGGKTKGPRVLGETAVRETREEVGVAPKRFEESSNCTLLLS